MSLIMCYKRVYQIEVHIIIGENYFFVEACVRDFHNFAVSSCICCLFCCAVSVSLCRIVI